MVLTYNVWFAIPIVLIGTALLLLLNTGVAVPMVGAALLPLLIALHSSDWIEVLLALIAGGFLVFTHRENLKLALSRQDVVSLRSFLARLRKK